MAAWAGRSRSVLGDPALRRRDRVHGDAGGALDGAHPRDRAAGGLRRGTDSRSRAGALVRALDPRAVRAADRRGRPRVRRRRGLVAGAARRARVLQRGRRRPGGGRGVGVGRPGRSKTRRRSSAPAGGAGSRP